MDDGLSEEEPAASATMTVLVTSTAAWRSPRNTTVTPGGKQHVTEDKRMGI